MKNFTNEEFEKIFNKIYFRLIKNVNKNIKKKAFILGGQPGAGKSGLTNIIESKNDNIIVINGDDFRKSHPHYIDLREKYGDNYVYHTAEFSKEITEALIERLSNDEYGLVIEGTLRTYEVPLKTCNILKNKGYEVDLNIVQVRPEISLLGTFMRYESMLELGTVARETPIDHHNKVVEKMPDNLDIIYKKNIFDNIEIYDRSGNKLYSLKDTPKINPKDIFLEAFNRKLTKKEIEFLNENYKKVLVSMKKRNAPIKQIEMVKNEQKHLPKTN
ncbi:zeta toxin family protein [Oceanivirga salmonicida]|uniref:zeta toxin family protein n=1 Tax=Oceanivirga salmonicida TaxID=1769291 RepID=UPI0012E2D536|nr:zeta toxin family protein [Oceanivirga salmonicida]